MPDLNIGASDPRLTGRFAALPLLVWTGNCSYHFRQPPIT